MRRWKTPAIVVGAVILIVVTYLMLKWSGVDPNAFAAATSAIAAIAAFASARESSATARDAVRALSLSGKPQPELFVLPNTSGTEHSVTIRIVNNATNAITRGTLRYQLRTGESGTIPVEPISGARHVYSFDALGTDTRDYLIPTSAPATVAGRDIVTLDYWGPHGPLGWRATQTYTDQRQPVTEADLV